MIPEVERRLSVIREKRSFYLRAHDAVFVQELANEVEKKAGRDLFDSDLDKDIQGLEGAIEFLSKEIDELISLGCLLRSLDQGFVDFAGQHHGERVFFAWKSGEKKITFIRRRGAQISERIPLEQ